MRFIVPLGNRQWFVDCGIDGDRVSELDWWDCIELSPPASSTNLKPLKITCTPSQHNSGRSGFDADCTLWSSWYVEHPGAHDNPYRVFFAGDTGYQFHDSPGWPPPPPAKLEERQRSGAKEDLDDSPKTKHPACPAFKEIAAKLGSPHLILLPIAVGATYDFLRSWVPLPDSVSPFPRHSSGLTAHNHMPPWDAVRVLKVLTANAKTDEDAPVALAMHWGTFVTDPVEVLKTLGQLEWACDAHDVRFDRSLPAIDRGNQSWFLALNHGQSVGT